MRLHTLTENFAGALTLSLLKLLRSVDKPMDFPINLESLKFTGQGEKGQVLRLLSLEQQVKELILKEQAMCIKNFSL